jgi:hypothetical protein
MPYSPTPSAVHVDRLMTSFSIANIQSDDNFIAGRVFPGVPVTKQSDRYTRYPKGAWFRSEMAKRPPGTKAKSADYEVDTTPTYYCEGWSLRKPIADETRANNDAPMDPDRDTTLFLSQQAKIRKEKNFVANYWKTGVWGKDYTGVSGTPGANEFKQFNDATSTPIKFIRARRTEMARMNGGFRPNKLSLGREVFDALLDHPDIVQRVLYGGRNGEAAKTNLRILAELFELDEVLIMDAVENVAVEGATDDFQFIGGRNMLLSYSPNTPSLLMPCAGLTFSWTGFLPGQGRNMGEVISRFRVEDGSRAEDLQIDAYYDMKTVSPDCGMFFTNAVAAS